MEPEEIAKLLSIKLALDDYHLALDSREHGGVAADKFVRECEQLLDMPWRRGETKKRR